MKRKIKWSKWSLRDLENIQRYWDKHNASTLYSDRLSFEAISSAELIASQSYIGALAKGQKNIFKKLVAEHYLLIYRLLPDTVVILRFWDTRQNPRKLKRYLK